jgi:small multidrug resistance family-3 protein
MPRYLTIWAFLIVATTFEASGDALVRIGLFQRVAAGRVIALLSGATLLFGYGVAVNLAPLPFERVVGLYIATLFLVWQTVSFLTFQSVPSVPVMVGGALIVAGGLLVTFWQS